MDLYSYMDIQPLAELNVYRVPTETGKPGHVKVTEHGKLAKNHGFLSWDFTNFGP